ncbi:MAG: GNAT family N-acetyltransferase [Tateyamaria sp.]|uniref:GNAT family N-acetyltransferase n=1 Tax=Tateyamaria sp. TaxID=1929288 RepID=UPI00329FAABC
MTVHTRFATADDLPQLIEMISDLARFNDDEPQLNLHDLQRDMLGLQPWCTVIVAEAAQTDLLGYAALFPLGQLQFGRRGMDLHHLFIRASARGQGVGSKLIEACRAQVNALGCTFLTVGTAPGNHKAAAFYEARGFKRRTRNAPRFAMKLEGPDQPPT